MVNTDYTLDAVEMAKWGGYFRHLHFHPCIASGLKATGNMKPLTDEVKECGAWCKNGDFRVEKDWDFSNTKSFRYANVIYREIEAQYVKFLELTQGEANSYHVDFHFYDNLRWPVSWAYGKLIRKYGIRSARYIETYRLHIPGKRNKVKNLISLLISYNPYVKSYKSSRVNYFLNNPQIMDARVIELYVHPDYVDGKLIENSIQLYGDKKKKELEEHIKLIKDNSPCEFISWEDI